jgi:hypothetical protein
MPSRLTIAIAAFAALASAPAFGASGAIHDDTTYPATPASWTAVNASADQPATHDDVAYPGAHMTIAKQPAPRGSAGLVAVLDDTTYPTEDSASARPADRAMPALERLACGCTRR